MNQDLRLVGTKGPKLPLPGSHHLNLPHSKKETRPSFRAQSSGRNLKTEHEPRPSKRNNGSDVQKLNLSYLDEGRSSLLNLKVDVEKDKVANASSRRSQHRNHSKSMLVTPRSFKLAAKKKKVLIVHSSSSSE